MKRTSVTDKLGWMREAGWIACTGLIGMLMFTSCTNSKRDFSLTRGTTPTSVPTTNGPTLRISSVTIAAPSGTTNTSTAYTTSIFFDTTNSAAPIASYCTSSSASGTAVTSKPCICQFTWQEINQTTGTAVQIPRTVQTQVTTVQPSSVQCAAPDVYSNDNEIRRGTVIKVTVIAGPGNSDGFTVTPFNHTKSGNTVLGTFQDAQGQAFDNILHYSCYEQSKRGTSVTNKIDIRQDPNTGNPINLVIASQFCVQKASTPGGIVTPGCPNNVVENTAQSYYYNLYIRDSERGDINSGNSQYVCPQVRESLQGGGTVGTTGQFWPLDRNFALSIAPTSDFNIGVEAFTKVSNGADPVTQGSACFPSGNTSTGGGGSGGGGSSSATGLVKSCLGFAAKPASDGTCPYFRDSTGSIRLTYRLRRYVAVYPPIFDTDGSPLLSRGLSTDTIYVLDRPVNSATADPLKPFTMRGPKPCPFAYFDSKGVTGIVDAGYPTGNRPIYAATNNSRWTGTNVDGTKFPNTDSANSCAAPIPLISSDKRFVTLGTVHTNNPAFQNKYIRPVTAWSPHYEEDTEFQACAPQATPLKDPPLHFARDTTGNVAWCAEYYPSQNDNVASLDYRTGPAAAFVGRVTPFTSHVAKNSASAQCTRTLPTIPSGYPALAAGACPAPASATCETALPAGAVASVAWHPTDLVWDGRCDKTTTPGTWTTVCSNATCDRTIVSGGTTWPKFPLLATAPQVEAAIRADSSYNCTITYDNNGPKKDKVTPTQGCCGVSVDLWTGVAAGGAPPVTLSNSSAHLEPDATCLIPQY